MPPIPGGRLISSTLTIKRTGNFCLQASNSITQAKKVSTAIFMVPIFFDQLDHLIKNVGPCCITEQMKNKLMY
jgi:hypothetical protein